MQQFNVVMLPTEKASKQSNEQLLDEILNEDFEQVIPTTPLPKTQQEFIDLLNTQVEGWVFTGSNPFTEANLRNHRLYDALQRMAVELFDTDDLGALEDLWERLVFETKPNYNGVKIDFIWLCECAKQYTPNEELELLKARINSLKQFFNDPEIVSIINS